MPAFELAFFFGYPIFALIIAGGYQLWPSPTLTNFNVSELFPWASAF